MLPELLLCYYLAVFAVVTIVFWLGIDSETGGRTVVALLMTFLLSVALTTALFLPAILTIIDSEKLGQLISGKGEL